MFHVELFLIGVVLVFITITLTFLDFDLLWGDFYQGMLFLIYIVLVLIAASLEHTSSLSSSSAAPPACLDGFIVEINGGTGGAYTCTPLDP